MHLLLLFEALLTHRLCFFRFLCRLRDTHLILLYNLHWLEFLRGNLELLLWLFLFFLISVLRLISLCDKNRWLCFLIFSFFLRWFFFSLNFNTFRIFPRNQSIWILLYSNFFSVYLNLLQYLEAASIMRKTNQLPWSCPKPIDFTILYPNKLWIFQFQLYHISDGLFRILYKYHIEICWYSQWILCLLSISFCLFGITKSW